MNKSLVVSLSVILCLVFLVIGGFVGVFYQTQKDVLQLDKSAAVVKGITSQVIPSIVAYGQVSNINGRDVTLAFSGDVITISVKPDATIYSFASQGAIQNGVNTASRQPINFSEIKKGDTLNISMKVSPSGQFIGDGVVVLPAH